MKNFQELDLNESLYKSLAKMNYSVPTDIQAQAIPVALQGHDILGSAQTGTGKTAAFSIPMIETLLRDESAMSIVLTPTRELAKQVLDVINQLLGYPSTIRTAFIIGGEHMGKQFKQLKAKPRIIVGTPGRINDHLRRGSLNLDQASFLVLDETDRMLDMGFGVQLDEIIKHMPRARQTLMFSATLPDAIINMSRKYMNDPVRISVGATNVIAPKIKQEVVHVSQDQKYKELVNQLHDRDGSVIVFMKTKRAADRVAKNLNRDGFEADALHGDLRQNKRTTVMRKYREKKFRILVATDIAARGLDVPHIEHVINHDLPQVAEDYIHRMGRTARAGADGQALSLIAPHDGRNWHASMSLLDPSYKGGRGDNDNGSRSGGRKKKKSYGKKDTYKSGKPRRDASAFGDKKKSKPKYKSKHTRTDERGDNGAGSRKPKRPDTRTDKRTERSEAFTKGQAPFKSKKKPFRSEEKSSFKGRDRFEKSSSKHGGEKRDGARTDFTKPRSEKRGHGKPHGKPEGETHHGSKRGGAAKAGRKNFQPKFGDEPAGKKGGKAYAKSGGKPSGKKAGGGFDAPRRKTKGKKSFSDRNQNSRAA